MTENQLKVPLNTQIDTILGSGLPDRHSFFQLKHFVIGKEYTTQGKMWQCLRELKARKSSLEALEREIEETKDRLELIDIQRERGSHAIGLLLSKERDQVVRDLAIRESKVKHRQLARKAGALTESLKELGAKRDAIEEEALFLLDTMEQLLRVEDLKSMDDLEAQKAYWTEKLANEVHLKLLLRQPLDTDLVKTVLTLHDDSPIKQQVLIILTKSREALENLEPR